MNIDPNLIGIYEVENGNYSWVDGMFEDEFHKALFFIDPKYGGIGHGGGKSALYDDMTGYVDVLDNEGELLDGELYAVTYYSYNDSYFGLDQNVDFGITKQDIIENVKSQKYVECANYYTMGQMFRATKDVLEGNYENI